MEQEGKDTRMSLVGIDGFSEQPCADEQDEIRHHHQEDR